MLTCWVRDETAPSKKIWGHTRPDWHSRKTSLCTWTMIRGELGQTGFTNKQVFIGEVCSISDKARATLPEPSLERRHIVRWRISVSMKWYHWIMDHWTWTSWPTSPSFPPWRCQPANGSEPQMLPLCGWNHHPELCPLLCIPPAPGPRSPCITRVPTLASIPFCSILEQNPSSDSHDRCVATK